MLGRQCGYCAGGRAISDYNAPIYAMVKAEMGFTDFMGLLGVPPFPDAISLKFTTKDLNLNLDFVPVTQFVVCGETSSFQNSLNFPLQSLLSESKKLISLKFTIKNLNLNPDFVSVNHSVACCIPGSFRFPITVPAFRNKETAWESDSWERSTCTIARRTLTDESHAAPKTDTDRTLGRQSRHAKLLQAPWENLQGTSVCVISTMREKLCSCVGGAVILR
ncbi:hypothetical protein CEXT_274061 [Caerostris extrusa]|uniref:Uncharacterized protein n=1 Tax=Caerostris extrusa TaxID=172846 RepID=A0AAV4T4H1_CAEEX|nr:hypothetical protein CEXT_274061 [Caerostris extrusa]